MHILSAPPLLPQVLLDKGVQEGKILFLCLIAAPEGIHKVRDRGAGKGGHRGGDCAAAADGMWPALSAAARLQGPYRP